jgi:anti-anti-sigma factor
MTQLNQSLLTVYEKGPTTLVGFNPSLRLDEIDMRDMPEYRAEIIAMLQAHGSTSLALDLKGVVFIPSPIFGLLISIKKLGIIVHLHNPTMQIREVLEITHLNELFQIHDTVPQ